jgi:hypothetical protein
MKTEELLIVGGVIFLAYYMMHRPMAVTTAPTYAPPPQTYTPTPSVSPYYGYPSNIMNPSASANNGQAWTSQDTAAAITAGAGLIGNLVDNFS